MTFKNKKEELLEGIDELCESIDKSADALIAYVQEPDPLKKEVFNKIHDKRIKQTLIAAKKLQDRGK